MQGELDRMGAQTVEIEGIGSELQGVARAQDGRVLFVPGALPGELVEARVERAAKSYCQASLLRVLRPSPDRAEPSCPVYGACGGCQAQHMLYSAALACKRAVVRQALERIGGLDAPEVRPTIGMDAPWRYRNKAEYAVGMEGGRAVVGFRARASHAVVPACECLLQAAASAQAARLFERWLRAHRISGWDEIARRGQARHLIARVNCAGELMLIVSGEAALPHLSEFAAWCFRDLPGMHSLYHLIPAPRAAHALDGTLRLIAGAEDFFDELLGLRFRLSPKSFFQVNRAQAEALYRAALEAARLTGTETVVDAYCGAGTISLAMARQARSVIGIELLRPAVENAVENARRNCLADRAEFIEGDAPETLDRLVRQGLRPDVIAVDPPRKGLTPLLIDAIRRARPQRLVYVSCDPATLARDARALLADNAFRLDYAQPVDMFCQTEHVETVVLMSRK